MPQNLFGTNQSLENDHKNAPSFGVPLILEIPRLKQNCSRVFIDGRFFNYREKNEYSLYPERIGYRDFGSRNQMEVKFGGLTRR